MQQFYFPACSIFIVTLLMISFFSKQRVKNTETDLYRNLLISNFLETMCAFVVLIVGYNYGVNFFVFLLNKLDFVFCLGWIWSFFLYIDYVSFDDKKSHEPMYKFVYKVTSIFNLVALLLILILPLDVYVDSVGGTAGANVAYAFGPSVNILYIVAVIHVVGIIICVFKNRKNIINKKYIPLYVLVFMLILSLLIRQINPGILILSLMLSYIDLIMYFTIENPDVKMIEQLDLAKKQAEKANNAKTEFLSSMSHEIRTPLNAIVGFSNAIMDDETLEDAKDEAKDIVMASENLLEIVNGILDISKIEAGKMEIVNVDYKPVKMYKDIAKLVKPRIGEKPIELKTKFSSDIPGVLNGDMGKVKEIITNLLTNAAKYTDKGLITFEVSCINQKDLCKMVISVEDTGRGIKPDKVDKLFNKFERLEEDRNTTLEGTGLGLAITKSLVEMMGGRIIVQSKYGSGSKFIVYLSQKIVSMEDTENEEEDQKIDIVDYSKKKILLVDDNSLNLKVATRMLKNYKIVPDTCNSGFECLDKVKESNYDLILLDDMMPKMSGVETFKKLKEDKDFDIPVIVLTANAVSGMKEKYLKEGFNDYLAKPIDRLELDRVLGEFLKKK